MFFDYVIIWLSLHLILVIFAFFNALQHYYKTGNGIIVILPALLSFPVFHCPSMKQGIIKKLKKQKRN